MSGGQTPAGHDDHRPDNREPRGRRVRYQHRRISRLRDDFEVTRKALWREYHGIERRLDERMTELADHPEAAAVTDLRREFTDFQEATAQRQAAIERRLDELASQVDKRMDDFLAVFAKSAGWLADEAERLRR